jgi:DNA-3-methyladenine glycosylase
MELKEVDKKFFEKSTIQVAKGLLGKYLVKEIGRNLIVGRIVETEAYLKDDPASHSYKGKTRRNAQMFNIPGMSYVYFTYGMYHCLNLVTNKKDVGEAVLIRAVEPISGICFMKRHRKKKDEKNLTNGPAKVCQAFNITKEDNAINMKSKFSPIRIMKGEKDKFSIVSTTRIGISKGKEKPHRFYIKDNRFISKK